MTRPVTPPPRLIPGSPDHTLLRRVMKVRSESQMIERIVVVDRPDLRMTLRDTGPDGTRHENTVNDTAIQLLWAMDDVSSHLVINDRHVPFAPGDTILLPNETSWRASANLILCEIAGPEAKYQYIDGPTHGTATFHGYNRETIYPAPSGLSISRWKITQPLTLDPIGHDRLIIDLATPVTLLWPGGTDIIGGGGCRLIPAGAGPTTLFPDGLGYFLLIRKQ